MAPSDSLCMIGLLKLTKYFGERINDLKLQKELIVKRKSRLKVGEISPVSPNLNYVNNKRHGNLSLKCGTGGND